MHSMHQPRTGESGRVLLLLGCVMFLSAGAVMALSLDLAPLLSGSIMTHGS